MVEQETESYNDKLDRKLVDMYVCLRNEGMDKMQAITKIASDLQKIRSVVKEEYVRRVLE